MIMLSKSSIKKILLKIGYKIQRITPHKDMPLPLWENDTIFNSIFGQITKHTIVDKVRCFMIYQYALQVSSLPGDVAEVGVYKGGTARLLAKTFQGKEKIMHLFDTFSGMPPSDRTRDTYKEGDFGDTTFKTVKKFLGDCDNVRLYKGVFPIETSDPVRGTTFCLAHIDADIYRSVMDSCEFFYPRLTKGGVIIFDDYGFPLCSGAKQAVDEYFAGKIERPCYLQTGQCIVSKL